ncbi:MAG: DUF4445 domain-containing protein [Deltaproteobacteria bacterium]|nr:DUF4445 domain-containing protein [Deltaproteobacteria bacterium]MBW2152105.1 DUF4445 domain-containing protein [Deltaproteobacteria bacterium]
MNNKQSPDAKQTKNYRVTFQPMGICCKGSHGHSLLKIASDYNILIRSDCGGQGRCGKCVVTVNPPDHFSPPTENETNFLTPEQIGSGHRLACQAKVLGCATVSLSEAVLDNTEALGKAGIQGVFSSNPMVKRLIMPVVSSSKPGGKNVRDFMELVSDKAEKIFGKPLIFKEPEAVRMLSRPISKERQVTFVDHSNKGVTAVFPGRRDRSLGAAIDLGTTTLAVYLCDLLCGIVICSDASANPQRRFGEDVISRITYANDKKDGLNLLRKVVIDECNELLKRCVKQVEAELEDIDEITVVGNTTMQQIFMGIHPHGLGFSPYLPVSCDPQDLRAGDVGLELSPGTNVHVFPVISGFVGGDTMGVILSERPHEKEEISLIVDIGTNGEVVLGNRDGLWTSSCATGPALEGAHIECGMRAASGAIHKVSIDRKTYRASYQFLGNEQVGLPRGICGSGIIDAIAGMLQSGLILPSGRIKEGLPGVVVDEKGIGRKFILAPPQETANGMEIGITLSDVRQIQLAKAALSVGIKLLMRRAGVSHFDRLVLTGAFGARFDWKNAVAIGMLPQISNHTKVKVVSNAAGRGAVMALLDGALRRNIHEVSKRVRFIELAEDPDFVSEFTVATLFPTGGGAEKNGF